MKSFFLYLFIFSSLATHANWHDCFSEFKSLFDLVEKSALREDEAKLEDLKNLADLDVYLEKKDFINSQYVEKKLQIDQHNKIVKELLENEEVLKDSIDGKGLVLRGGVTQEQAKSLYEDMVNTPCVRSSAPYERVGVSLGYCFGRAIIASMHGLKRSVHPGAMKKIWVTGEMTGNWGHHVALMVRGENGEWFVIDNVTGLVTHDVWMKRMEDQYKQSKSLMFFATRPERFGPQINEVINDLNLFNLRNSDWSQYDRDGDYYKGFFKDFFEWFDEQEEPIPFQ